MMVPPLSIVPLQTTGEKSSIRPNNSVARLATSRRQRHEDAWSLSANFVVFMLIGNYRLVMVRDDLLRILAESLTVIVDRPVTSLTIDMSLADNFGLESIEILDFFVEVEQRLGRPIDLIELLRSRTSTSNYSKDICIRDIVEFIESKEKP